MGNMMIDITGLGEYTPYEGLGRSDLFSKDGIFMLAINKAVAGISNESRREKITLALSVIDDPEKQDDGKTVVHTLVVGGVDKNGKPMIRQLGDLLLSIGYSVEQIKNFAAKKTIDLEALCKDTLMKGDKPVRVFGQVAAEVFTGDDGTIQTSSKIQNFVAKAKYDEALAVRAHRKAHRYGNGAPAAGAAAGAVATDASLGAPATGGGLGAPGAVAAAAKPAGGDLAGL